MIYENQISVLIHETKTSIALTGMEYTVASRRVYPRKQFVFHLLAIRLFAIYSCEMYAHLYLSNSIE